MRSVASRAIAHGLSLRSRPMNLNTLSDRSCDNSSSSVNDCRAGERTSKRFERRVVDLDKLLLDQLVYRSLDAYTHPHSSELRVRCNRPGGVTLTYNFQLEPQSVYMHH